MKNIYKFKIYSLSKIEDKQEEINEMLNKKMESVKKVNYSERLNKTNGGELGGDNCVFGYKTEIILSTLDNTLEYKNIEGGEKYDFIKEGLYIDVKGVKIGKGKGIKDIIEKKYSIYLLKDQVQLAKKFCDNNNIPYTKYRYEIIWWNDTDEESQFIRAISNTLYLSEILKTEPVFENPPYTNGSDTNWNYKIKMVSNDSEQNIIL